MAKRYLYKVEPLGLVHERTVIAHAVSSQRNNQAWTLISTYVDPSNSVVYGIFETWTKERIRG